MINVHVHRRTVDSGLRVVLGALLALGSGCAARDRGVEDPARRFVCSDDDDCLGGWVCAPSAAGGARFCLPSGASLDATDVVVVGPDAAGTGVVGEDTLPDGSAPDAAASDLVADAAGDGCDPRRLAPGEVRARVVACAAELVGGPRAAGRVGDLLIENDRVRFVVRAGPEAHFLLGLYGGGLVDADRVRPAGEPGRDLLDEIQPIVSLNAVAASAVEVAADGSAGPAVVRVTGRVVPVPILAAVLPAFPVAATVTQDYELAADSDYLTLRTRVRIDDNADSAQVLPADVLFFGGALRSFAPGFGFETETIVTGPFSASAGPGVSYGYVPPDGLHLVDAGGLALALYTSRGLRPGEELVLERYFVVGDGSVSSVTDVAYDLLETPTADVIGTVYVDGSPAGAGFEVRALDGRGKPVTHFLTDDSGRFAGRLPTGSATLLGTCPGCADGAPVAIDAGADSSDIRVDVAAAGRVDLLVTESGLGPVPARVLLTPTDREGARSSLLLAGRERRGFPVVPGSYRATVSRGFEYEAKVVDDVIVRAGATTPLEVSLLRTVPTPGAVAADFHLHSENSTDSAVPLADRVLACAAEGVEFAVATDHDFVTDYAPTIRALDLTPFLASAPGSEISSIDAGHFNAWPLALDADRSGAGSPAWFGLPPAALAALARGDDPLRIVQVNHPRFENGSTFDLIDYDPLDGRAHADPVALGFPADTDLDVLDIDAYELFNGIGDEDLDLQLTDWFSLVERGRRITATAGSDSHGLDAYPGHPRNMVFVDDDDPARLDPAAVAAAVRAMRVVVTTGPHLEVGLEVPGSGALSALGDVVTDTDGEVALHVRVLAPTWMPVDELVVWQDGAAAATFPLEEPAGDDPFAVIRFDDVVILPVVADSWLVVIARGATRAWPLARYAPFALANPVFVDADGDGAFR